MEGQKQIRKLLSLDGGGVRGMSTIAILKELMKKLARKRGVAVVHPWQEFDMIGGTSTGGLLAIMLGRLRMSIDQCEKAYAKFSQDIFTPRSSTAFGRAVDFISADGKFSTEALEKYIKEMVDDAGLRQSEKLEDLREDSPKTFVSAVRQENGAATVIRSYENPNVYNHLEDCMIWEAARATSAASTFFEPISIGPNQETYVDGALGLNNPIRLLDRESKCLWPHDDRVFLSIGTGQASDVNLEGNLLALTSRLKDMVVETEKTAQGFEMDNQELLERNRYFRFTVKDGLRGIGLEEFKARGKIHAATATYLENVDVMRRVKQFVSVVSVDSSNVAHEVGYDTPSPYPTHPQANSQSIYSLAVRPPYPAPPTNGYGAQSSPNMGYGQNMPSRTTYGGVYSSQLYAPQPSTIYGSNMPHPSHSAPASMPYGSTLPPPPRNSPPASTPYGSTIPQPNHLPAPQASTPFSASMSPPPPHSSAYIQPPTASPRIPSPNPAARNGLTFQQQLQAKKQQGQLDKQLMQAVVRNNGPLVESLLQQGADVNALGLTDVIGHNLPAPPIYVAAHQNHNDILRILLRYNASVDTYSGYNKGTALSAAIWAQNIEAIEELLAAGADPNLECEGGSPLLRAISRKNMEIIELLIMAGADVNFKPKFLTAVLGVDSNLAMAAGRYYPEAVRCLVNNGADVEGLTNEATYKYVQQCMAG